MTSRTLRCPDQTMLALLVISVFASLAGPAREARAATATCARYASATGSDGNAGTAAAPFRTLPKLTSSLTPGQTGCLVGDFGVGLQYGDLAIVNAAGTSASPIRITSAPGQAATFRGQIWIKEEAHDIVFDNISFLGTRGITKGTHLIVDGDRITFRNNDITSPDGICLDVGEVDAYNSTAVGARADDLVIDGNRIHDCGKAAPLTTADSGVHGVYLVHTLNAKIVNNYIFDNRVRGVQLWPRAHGTLIANNVIDGNSGNLNLGSWAPNGHFSTNTTVRDNIISNGTFGFSKDSHQVFGNFPNDGTDRGNRVFHNCVFHSDPARNFGGYGFTHYDNTLSDPRFVDRTNKDFRLTSGSPCWGKGPQTIQQPEPQPQPDADCTIVGTEGNDVLNGTSKDDVICGLGGNDVIRPLDGADIVDGGAGVDRVSYLQAPGAVVINMSQDSAWNRYRTGWTEWDRFRSIEQAFGSAFADHILGDAAGDHLQGGGGADEIYGLGGADSIYGGLGADRMFGGAGNDFLSGNEDVDHVDGGSEYDTCHQGDSTRTGLFSCEA